MENEKVEALMQEMDIQRKALARAREMVEAIYQEKQVQAITCNYVGINDLAGRLDWGRSDPALEEHGSDIIAYRIPEEQ